MHLSIENKSQGYYLTAKGGCLGAKLYNLLKQYNCSTDMVFYAECCYAKN